MIYYLGDNAIIKVNLSNEGFFKAKLKGLSVKDVVKVINSKKKIKNESK